MKRFLAIFAAAVVSAWLRYHYATPAPTAPAAPPQTMPAARNTAPKPAANLLRHVVCPLCNGQRGLVYADGAKSKRDDCPVCINVHGVPLGYRNVRVLPGYELCDSCQGMGLVVTNQSTHPPRVDNCTLCGGTGVIRIPK